jgi:pteridine reductase
MNIQGKTIILTGAKRIGKTVALNLAEKGANLVLTYLTSDQEETESLANQCREKGVQVLVIKADLSKQDEVLNLVNKTQEQFKNIHGLIHMTAIYPHTPWANLSEEDFDKTVSIISKSTFLISKACADVMLQNEGDDVVTPEGVVGKIKGKIITISDWSIFRSPYIGYLPYNTAKAAVVGLTLSLAKELAPSITVNNIAPGPILRPANLSDEENTEAISKTPLNCWGGAEEISKAIMYLLDADFVTGIVLPVDGGRSIG